MKRKEVKDIVAYLRLVHNPADRDALLRIINTPTRGIGKRTEAWLVEAADFHGISPWEAICAVAGGSEEVSRGLSGRAAAALTRFHTLIADLQSAAAAVEKLSSAMSSDSRVSSLSDFIDHVVSSSGYAKLLEKEAESDDLQASAASGITVLDQLRVHAQALNANELPTLLDSLYLEDDAVQRIGDVEPVKLMTFHTAKGLEFDSAFIIGAVDGLVPHFRTVDIDEERRAFYVALTRARKRLVLSYFRTQKSLSGWARSSEPSPFLPDVAASMHGRVM